ncbi:MAG: hypothetical protein ACTSUE_09875 [Promethearchaeota archaeon]
MPDKTQEARGERWTAVRYEDRVPKRGKARANDYHAQHLFPNYSQFSRTKTGPTMVDTLGRQYQIADGIDRLEDQERGLVANGSPYEVEPILQEFGTNSSIVFSGLGGETSSYTFTLASDKLVDKSTEATYPVSRGSQLLYIRIPIRERRNNPWLTFPTVSENLKLFHSSTSTRVTGVVQEVDGFQFPKGSTGSVRVDDLTFLINRNRLSL